MWTPTTPKIAIVDDDREIRTYLRFILRGHGYEVLEASSGLRLISLLRVDQPDLILLDVMMSWIDGFDLCRSLKSNPDYRSIPICMVSALSTDELERRGIACGAAAWFSKPFDADALVATIAQLTARRASLAGA